MTNPIKFSWKREIFPLIILALSLLASIYFYAHFPDRVVSHWNFYGAPDATSSKAVGSFGIFGILLFIYVLFLFIPRLDPKKERYEEFAPYYWNFRTAILAVLFLIHIFSSLFNLGYPVKINLVVPFTIGILFILLGNWMAKIKRNWFVGVRTPFTLESEDVWNKTNRFGGFAMVAAGISMIIIPFLPSFLGLALFILSLGVLVIGTFVYSYLLYRKERAAKQVEQ